jgi:hypothetical protein
MLNEAKCEKPVENKHMIIVNKLMTLGNTINELQSLTEKIIDGNVPHCDGENKPPMTNISLANFLNNAPSEIDKMIDALGKVKSGMSENLF